MFPHRITAKIFVADGVAFDPPAFIPLFHRWIQRQTAPGLLIDVAEYLHVPQGPGVVLVGHHGDYALDFAEGRPGLLYRGKRQGWADGRSQAAAEAPVEATAPAAAALEARLRRVLDHLLQAAAALQPPSRPALTPTPALSFRPDEIEWSFPDRLQTPNDASGYRAMAPRLAAVLVPLFPGVEVSLHQTHTDPRFPLTITATLTGASKDPWTVARQALRAPSTGQHAVI